MANKRRQFDKQFKIDALKYCDSHANLTLEQCAKNLGVGYSTLLRWRQEFKENDEVQFRGSGNYKSDVEKENARLKRELKDTQDALEILKKAISILGD